MLSDRYTTSNAVHQGAKLPPEEQPRFFDWLYDLEYVKLGLPRPDLVIFLDVDLATSEARMHRRQLKTGKSGDIHERDTEYLQLCLDTGHRAAAHYGWRVVDFMKDGKEREVERKLFPGYVLVKMVMTDDSWYIVRNTRGVTGFVGPSSKPIPLTDEEVDKLGVDVREVSLDYAVGDNVQIMNGPLEGFIGIVEGIDTDAKKVNVKVSMFGRETPAELDFTQVKPRVSPETFFPVRARAARRCFL